MAGIVGGPRHYTGPAAQPQATVWVCPACKQKNTSRFEDGCPGCGAGTQAQIEAAQQAVKVSTVAGPYAGVTFDTTQPPFAAAPFTTVEMEATLWDLPEVALRTIIGALEYALVMPDYGNAIPLSLPRAQVVAWVTLLKARLGLAAEEETVVGINDLLHSRSVPTPAAISDLTTMGTTTITLEVDTDIMVTCGATICAVLAVLKNLGVRITPPVV